MKYLWGIFTEKQPQQAGIFRGYRKRCSACLTDKHWVKMYMNWNVLIELWKLIYLKEPFQILLHKKY